MQNKIVAGIAIVIIVIVVIGGYSAWIVSNPQNQPQATPTPSPTPELTIQEQIRDETMDYVKTNHPQTADLMTNLSWTGGRQETDQVGSETYMYTSANWIFIVNYPVVPDPEYIVTADYSAEGVTVNWVGTYKGGNITETSYTYT